MDKIGVAFGGGKAIGIPILGVIALGVVLFMAGRNSDTYWSK